MSQSVVEIAPKDEIEKAAFGYFLHLVNRDLDAFEAIWQEDAIQDIPFPPEGFGKFVTPQFIGREEIMRHYRAAFENRRDHVFWIDEVYRPDDGKTIIIEAHARSVVGETAKVYENSYVCIFTIADGKIERLKEFANPLAFMNAFGGGFDKHA
jgi:ketosteroid isomerase-like protein